LNKTALQYQMMDEVQNPAVLSVHDLRAVYSDVTQQKNYTIMRLGTSGFLEASQKQSSPWRSKREVKHFARNIGFTAGCMMSAFRTTNWLWTSHSCADRVVAQ
jgi:hypothetical protein